MRSFLVGLALVAASTPALAIDKGAETMLRAASAQAAIMQFCASRFQIDEGLSMSLGKTAHDAAFQVLGPLDGDTELKGELSRRFGEVQEMGEDRWCQSERARYNEQRIPVFKN